MPSMKIGVKEFELVIKKSFFNMPLKIIIRMRFNVIIKFALYIAYLLLHSLGSSLR